MKIRLLLILTVGISNISSGQNLNMIIQVNERLVTTDISGVYLNFESIDGTESKVPIGYHPGELILNHDCWEKLESELTEKITLTFDYNAFKGKDHDIDNFACDMQKKHFDTPYLILNIYDFNERKFRKRYGCLTDKDYLAELNFPGGGVFVQCE